MGDRTRRTERLADLERVSDQRPGHGFDPDVWSLLDDPDVILAFAEFSVVIDDGADPVALSHASRAITDAMDRAARRRDGIPEPISVADHPDPPGPGWLSDGRTWHANLARPATPEMQALIRASAARVLNQQSPEFGD